MFIKIDTAEGFEKAVFTDKPTDELNAEKAANEIALQTAIFQATKTYNEVYKALHAGAFVSFLKLRGNTTLETSLERPVNWTTIVLDCFTKQAPHNPTKHGYKVVSGCLLYNGIPIYLRNASSGFFCIEVVNPDNNESQHLSFYWGR